MDAHDATPLQPPGIVEPRGPVNYVGPNEFLQLAVSRRSLVRADDAATAMRGLVDKVTGTRYVLADSVVRPIRLRRRSSF